MLRARKKILSLFGVCSLLMTAMLHAQTWQSLSPGLEYRDLNANSLSLWSHIHVFRIDPRHQKLAIALAKDMPHRDGFAQAFQQNTHALIAINGGFFTPERAPIGLRMSEHKLINPLKSISWWGVFAIKDQKAMILSHHDVPNHPEFDFAIQAGPRLLSNKKIISLRPGYANRSALGITAKGQIIMLVTENMPMTMTELAQIMARHPLNCIDALNLDGGSSTQAFARINHFYLNVPGFAQVSDAIIVKE